MMVIEDKWQLWEDVHMDYKDRYGLTTLIIWDHWKIKGKHLFQNQQEKISFKKL